MKNQYIINALCISTIFFTGCQEEDIVSGTPRIEGDEIVFGVRAGFENGQGGTSRTEYKAGETFESGGKTYQYIDWVPTTDKVSIYCKTEDSSDPNDEQTVNYKVSAKATGEGSGQKYAILERSENEAVGLKWGDIEKDHVFYAMYPSSEMIAETADSIKSKVSLDGSNKVIKGYIPHTQIGTIPTSKTAGVWVVKPDMTYAYMAAHKSIYSGDGSNAVNLTFYPIVTALEIQLTLPAGSLVDMQLTDIRLTSHQPLTGAFQCDLSSWGGMSVPTCENITGQTLNIVTIPLWQKKGDNYVPFTLKAGEAIRFTAFILPGSDIESLSIGIHTTTGIKSHVLFENGSGFTLAKQKKYNISGLKLPSNIDIDLSKWMSQLDDEYTLGELSVPGTGASFSYEYNSADAKYYQAQNLDFEQQWNAGIRAFEIISDRPANESYSSANHLGKVQAMCNGVNLGTELTLSNIFKEIATKITNTGTIDPNYPNGTEFAFVMLTYQPTNSERDAEEYVKSLAEFYKRELATNELYIKGGFRRFEFYTPGMKLKDARGKIFIAVRASQHIEDDDPEHNWDGYLTIGSEQMPIMMIKGAGSAKDKWGCRGYKVKVANTGNDANDWKPALDIQPTGAAGYNANDRYNADEHTDYFDYPVVENYMTVTTEGTNAADINSVVWPAWNERVMKPAADGSSSHFEYETNIIKDKDATDPKDRYHHVWFQEWQRVVPRDMKLSLGRCGYTNPHHFYVYWHESYTEKVEQVKRAFEMAIGDDAHSEEYIYINSLCGYYVDANERNSYLPYADDPCTEHGWYDGFDWPVGGQRGDLQGLAKDLNNMLYNHILEKGYNHGTGPIGIVYMNCVKNIALDEDLGSYYLPGVIVANNFK